MRPGNGFEPKCDFFAKADVNGANAQEVFKFMKVLTRTGRARHPPSLLSCICSSCLSSCTLPAKPIPQVPGRTNNSRCVSPLFPSSASFASLQKALPFPVDDCGGLGDDFIIAAVRPCPLP